MTEGMIIALIAAVGSVVSGSGIWALLQRKSEKKSAYHRLLMGLAYDKIITIGMSYIQRGWITKDEYEEYLKFLVEPYKELGGNGVADRVATEVGSLKFRTVQFVDIVVKENRDEAQ